MATAHTANTTSQGDDYPLLSASTGRFRFGAPRSARPTGDGRGVVFIRSAASTVAAGDLWWLDLVTDQEHLLVATRDLLSNENEELPAAERARRERLREGSAGITAFSLDRLGSRCAFALSGRLFWLKLPAPTHDPSATHPPLALGAQELTSPGPVVDPRLSPDGRLVAWHTAGRLVTADLAHPEVLVLTPADDACWGLADFVAAEELERNRGFWWSPNSNELLVTRVDETAVSTWWISDPSRPSSEPRPVHYPAAGTTNAHVSLWRINLAGERSELLAVGGDIAPVEDRDEYLATVTWTSQGALALTLDRPQRRGTVHWLTGAAAGQEEVLQDEAWVDVVAGTPALTTASDLITVEPDLTVDRLRVCRDRRPFSPPTLQVRSVVSVAVDHVLALVATTPSRSDLVRIDFNGDVSPLLEGGWTVAVAEGDVVVATSATTGPWHTMVLREDQEPLAVTSYAAEVPVRPQPHQLHDSPVPTTVLLPSQGHDGPLPILMAPYGGPHAQKVMAAAPAYHDAQWLADQGFAVVIADGRGTPGISPSWEREVRADLADGVLADQVAALDAAIAAYPDRLRADRVGILGWSFGGFLAALAVLRRPDRFHAAVAGAPVTDWQLYDTAYTERYLGDPRTNVFAYRQSSLIDSARELSRPLLIIHGLADDNVVVAHTLALSSALLAAGRPHSVLPLSQVTHMTPQPAVAANLLRLQLDFLRSSLAD